MSSEKPETVEELMDSAVKHVRSIYEYNQDPAYQMHPMWYALTDQNELLLIMTPFVGDTPEEADHCKNVILRLMSMFFACRDVKAYVMAAEAWSAGYSKEQAEKNFVQPRDREDKNEIVAFTAATKDGKKIGVNITMNREATGRPVLGDLNKLDGYESMEGRLLNLLDTPPMPEPMKEALRAKFDQMGMGSEEPDLSSPHVVH